MKSLNEMGLDPIYFDVKGYPGCVDPEHRTWDGGDTAAIVGTMRTFGFSPSYPWVFFNRIGNPMRHWDQSKWYGQGDRFSRDQLIPTLCGMIASGDWTFVVSLHNAHARNCFLYAWNSRGNNAMDAKEKWPDITGPEVWALWMRLFDRDSWYDRILLTIFDVETLIGSIVWRFMSKSNRVTRNHMLVSIIARKYSPTWVSKLAFWLNDWDDLMWRWNAHCAAVGEIPTGWLFHDEIREMSKVR